MAVNAKRQMQRLYTYSRTVRPRLSAMRFCPQCHRYQSTAIVPADSLKHWIQNVTSAPATLASDSIELNRLTHLYNALSTRLKSVPPKLGDPLPPGHHLVLFNPFTSIDKLGEDGSFTVGQFSYSLLLILSYIELLIQEFNAPAPFLRRMWASGSFEFLDLDSLIIGQPIYQTKRISKVEIKSNDMLFVTQILDYSATPLERGEVALRELRTHVFRTLPSTNSPVSK